MLGVPCGVFGFGVHAYGAACFARQLFAQLQHFFQARDFELAIVLLAALCHWLFGAQGLDLGIRQIVGKPAFFGFAIHFLLALVACKFRSVGDVGGVFQIGFMAHNQHTVFGRYHIGLNEIGTQFYRAAVGF